MTIEALIVYNSIDIEINGTITMIVSHFIIVARIDNNHHKFILSLLFCFYTLLLYKKYIANLTHITHYCLWQDNFSAND